MRACFLGQNVCALGYGVATLQSPRLQDEETGQPLDGTATPLPSPGPAPNPLNRTPVPVAESTHL